MPHLMTTALLASAFALLPPTVLHAQDLAQAEQQFAARDFTGIIDTLLPAEEAGRLDDPQALVWLAIACEQAKMPPRNRAHACSRRRADIMIKAAERGHPEAMYLASIGLMGTGAGRIGLSIPFLDDGKRVDALMWAALAARFADSEDLYRRASARAADLARPLAQEMRGQETLGQRAMRMAEARRVDFESRGLATYDVRLAHGFPHELADEGAGDDYNPHIEDRSVMDCGTTPLRPGGSITVKLGADRHEKWGTQLGELAVWRVEGPEPVSFLLVYGDPSHAASMLMTWQSLVRASEISVPANLSAVGWDHMQSKRPVFTQAGRYTLYLTEAIESGAGGYVCEIEYRP
jgi:TPR repeat protein